MNHARLSYVCRSRFEGSTIAQALAWSEGPLLGVSLYGQGSFFQWIEGDQTLINHLITHLGQLADGFDLKIIESYPILQVNLSHSATHYLLEDIPVRIVLQQHGISAHDAIWMQEVLEQFQKRHPVTVTSTSLKSTAQYAE